MHGQLLEDGFHVKTFDFTVSTSLLFASPSLVLASLLMPGFGMSCDIWLLPG